MPAWAFALSLQKLIYFSFFNKNKIKFAFGGEFFLKTRQRPDAVGTCRRLSNEHVVFINLCNAQTLPSVNTSAGSRNHIGTGFEKPADVALATRQRLSYEKQNAQTLPSLLQQAH